MVMRISTIFWTIQNSDKEMCYFDVNRTWPKLKLSCGVLSLEKRKKFLSLE